MLVNKSGNIFHIKGSEQSKKVQVMGSESDKQRFSIYNNQHLIPQLVIV